MYYNIHSLLELPMHVMLTVVIVPEGPLLILQVTVNGVFRGKVKPTRYDVSFIIRRLTVPELVMILSPWSRHMTLVGDMYDREVPRR